jgi:hypothetical protein
LFGEFPTQIGERVILAVRVRGKCRVNCSPQIRSFQAGGRELVIQPREREQQGRNILGNR